MRLMSMHSVTLPSLNFLSTIRDFSLSKYRCVALGHAYPAAIGAKVAYPDRPVICLVAMVGF